MKLEDIQKDLKKRLSKERYTHSAEVAHAALVLAKRYGANPKEAELAGWIHDCAKELKLSEMQTIVSDYGLKLDSLMLESRALLHGPAGSILAETRYGIDNKEIQSAIYYHTTGRPQMSLLEKIIFLADYIEPHRNFPGVELIREKTKIDLDEGLLVAYNATISHLLKNDAYIYDLTFTGRNDLILQMEK